ncbi:peptide deformylase [Candidatus Parcubacteria bacterium]|nr:peptide deformylase [Candidatus Parcubacteria bacterium]
MIIKKVVQIGNPLLRQKSKFVTKIKSEATQKIVRDLADSVRFHKLVGMAVSQIGHKLRIFVTEIRETPARNPKNTDKLRVYINPKIIRESKKQVVIYEGCGSVAYGKFFGPIRRS